MTTEENSILLAQIHQLLNDQKDVIQHAELASDHIAVTVNGLPITITCQVHNDPDAHPAVAHAHIVVHTDSGQIKGSFDACAVGMNTDRKIALKEAAAAWLTAAAGPIFSLFYAKPVLAAEHFNGQQHWGVQGVHGFTGPLMVRMASEKFAAQKLIDRPFFEYILEIAPPGMVHLAKITLNAEKGRWRRTIEMGGHAASYEEDSFNAGIPAPQQAIVSCFVTFHLADQPKLIEERRKLDQIIYDFVEVFGQEKDTYKTQQVLIDRGYPPQTVDRVHQFLTLALGRAMITQRLPFQATKYYHRVSPTGEVSGEIPLMSEPAFARGFALTPELVQGKHAEAAKGLALCSAEINMVNNVLQAGKKIEGSRGSPFLTPDFGTTNEVFNQAFEIYFSSQKQAAKKKRPWWKSW